MQIDPRHVFENFIGTSANELVYKACIRFADFDEIAGNVLLIYGPRGVGKTHLLKAIAQHSLRSYRKKRVVYTTAESFTDALIAAIRRQETESFRAQFRTDGLLLVDDIHHIAGKEATQEEFYYTFDAVINQGGRIALASAVPPINLSTLSTLIESRIQMGLVMELKPPTKSDLYLIITKKYNTSAPLIPSNLIKAICDNSGGDVRKAEGLTKKILFTYSQTETFPSIREVMSWGKKADVTPDTGLFSIKDQLINILFLTADPSNASRLRLGEEAREIFQRLQLAKYRDQFVLHQRTSIRPEDLSYALLTVEPQIVHFSGHGTSKGSLCFENKLGETHPIQADTLAALFEQFKLNIKCVVLNACYSEDQANAIAQHIEYVIGMNKAIGDRTAIAFSVGFYQALAAGRSIEDAFKLGCIQIRLESIPDHQIPVLIHK